MPSTAAPAPATVVKYGTWHSRALRRIEKGILDGLRPLGRIDDQIDRAGLEGIPQYAGEPSRTLLHHLNRQSVLFGETHRCRAFATREKPFSTNCLAMGRSGRLIAVAHTDEDRARFRQDIAGGKLRFDKRHGKGLGLPP